MRRHEKSVELIELALILPALLLIVFGIVNFGVLFYDYLIVTNSAREGARWASIHSKSPACATTANNTDPCGVAINYIHHYLINFAPAVVTPTVSYSSPNTFTTGDLQTVTVTYAYQGIFLIDALSQTIRAQSAMLHE